jgi:hypothetical protein
MSSHFSVRQKHTGPLSSNTEDTKPNGFASLEAMIISFALTVLAYDRELYETVCSNIHSEPSITLNFPSIIEITTDPDLIGLISHGFRRFLFKSPWMLG